MKTLRLLARAACLTCVTAGWYAVLIAGDVLTLFASRRDERRQRCRRLVMRRWSGALCRALGVRVEVVGEPPREACLVVANHLGYLDVPVLGSLLGAVFVSKAEVARWPLLGHLATRGGTIYVDRERKRSLPEVNEGIQAALARGDAVVVFPEGTSTGGDEVLPFRPPLLAPAVELGLAVRCASLAYAAGPEDPPASESVCWWGDMPFGGHMLGLLRLSGVNARVVFTPGAVRGTNRKDLARVLRAAVSEGIQRIE